MSENKAGSPYSYAVYDYYSHNWKRQDIVVLISYMQHSIQWRTRVRIIKNMLHYVNGKYCAFLFCSHWRCAHSKMYNKSQTLKLELIYLKIFWLGVNKPNKAWKNKKQLCVIEPSVAVLRYNHPFTKDDCWINVFFHDDEEAVSILVGAALV